MMVMKYKRIFFVISLVLVLASLGAVIAWGLEPSIEFAGGTIIEVSFEDRPEKGIVEAIFAEHISPTSITVQPSEENNFIAKVPFLEEEVQNAVIESLHESGAGVERISSVGPTVGRELQRKAMFAILAVIVAIVIFIAFAFRKVSEPVSSWKYGVVAIVALLHDIIIPTGAFAVLGYLYGYQVDVLFITALLAILGFSVNDTIVVFDRVRENLKANEEAGLREDFEETMGRSLSQTYARSINTSVTTLLVLVLLLFVGSESTRHFALVMVIGIIAGVYSSIFLAPPLLVWWEKRSKKG